jgi:hypothetical protein
MIEDLNKEQLAGILEALPVEVSFVERRLRARRGYWSIEGGVR